MSVQLLKQASLQELPHQRFSGRRAIKQTGLNTLFARAWLPEVVAKSVTISGLVLVQSTHGFLFRKYPKGDGIPLIKETPSPFL
jgi:hypothetical protein